MTLRTRLLSVTIAMVAIVVIALAALNLNSLVSTWVDSSVDRAESAGRTVQASVVRRIEEGIPPATGPLTIPAVKDRWMQAIAKDQEFAKMLEQTMAQSRSIVEIEVAGEEGRILASSNPTRRGAQLRTRTDLGSLRKANPVARIRAILDSGADYQTTVTLGIPGQVKPVFTIQVLSSLILLRATVLPEMRDLGVVSAFGLMGAILLAWWAATIALRPLARVGHLIDSMTLGKTEEKRDLHGARELEVIESKLSLLGERFRTAREDASRLRTNLDEVLEKLDEETRRQFENEILLSRRLAAINSLTGRVAHEIKNPLNSIVLRLEMLRGRVGESDPGAESEIAVLSQEVVRLDRVVRTFLDFNRPVDVNIQDLDIAALVKEVIDFLAPEASKHSIGIEFIHLLDPVYVRADCDLIRQALTNVAVNALEAMECGGQLRIEVGQDDGLAVIRVSDTGPGISPENREKIFQLYFTTKTKGTGIGLAMTFRAIQLQGGSIDWTSEPGRGTTFRIALPLASMPTAVEVRV